MKIIGLKRSPEKTSDEGKACADEILTSENAENWDYVLGNSDFVLNVCPLVKETFELFDLEKFKKMKSSAYFMNIGRGKSVKEEDLIFALKEKIIAGAYLDVFYNEPMTPENELWKLDNVYITPHCADWTDDVLTNLVDVFLKNFRIYQSEGVSGFESFKVDKKLGY